MGAYHLKPYLITLIILFRQLRPITTTEACIRQKRAMVQPIFQEPLSLLQD